MHPISEVYARYFTLFLALVGFTACGKDAKLGSLSTLNQYEVQEGFQTVQLLDRELILAPGTTRSVPIPDGWRHVRRLTVEAEGIGRDGMFEVLANGDVKGTIYVPGRDPVYIVTIAEAARSLELRHTQGGQIRILSIAAVVSSASTNPPGGGGAIGGDGRALAAHIAYHTIDLSDSFHPMVTVDDWETYVLPIKIAAGRTYALARASGDLSGRVRNSLISLLAQMTLADPFIDRALRDNATFDLAVELLATRNRVEELLN